MAKSISYTKKGPGRTSVKSGRVRGSKIIKQQRKHTVSLNNKEEVEEAYSTITVDASATLFGIVYLNI